MLIGRLAVWRATDALLIGLIFEKSVHGQLILGWRVGLEYGIIVPYDSSAFSDSCFVGGW